MKRYRGSEVDVQDIRDLLSQYQDLKKEVKEIEERIGKMKIETDSVKGSLTESPYNEVTIKIEGVNPLYFTLDTRKNKVKNLLVEIEDFISDIPDSRTRRVFSKRYGQGFTWARIAREIGASDESYPRKVIHDRYLKDIING